jgi:hypothetical protein
MQLSARANERQVLLSQTNPASSQNHTHARECTSLCFLGPLAHRGDDAAMVEVLSGACMRAGLQVRASPEHSFQREELQVRLVELHTPLRHSLSDIVFQRHDRDWLALERRMDVRYE